MLIKRVNVNNIIILILIFLNNNNGLFMAPHLVRARSAYKDIRICSFDAAADGIGNNLFY